MIRGTPRSIGDEGMPTNKKKYRAKRSTTVQAWRHISDWASEKALKCYFCGDWIYAYNGYYSLDDLACYEDCLNLHYRQTAEPMDYQAELADLSVVPHSFLFLQKGAVHEEKVLFLLHSLS